MNESTPPEEQAQIVTYAGQLIQKTSRVHFNVGQEIVVTTEDKIRLCLTNHLTRIEKRKAWAVPLGILLTILVVFPTTSFQAFIFRAETWEAVFLMTGALSLFWLIRSLWQSRGVTSVGGFLISLWQGRASTIDDVVADIKRTAIATETSQAETAIVQKEPQVIFHDQFNSLTGWEQYGNGNISQSTGLRYSGISSLKKDGASDPNGGFRKLGRNVGLGLVFSGWIYSPAKRAGGKADRLAIEDSNFNGYGFTVDHRSNRIWIERREEGRPKPLEPVIDFVAPEDQWYQFRFYLRTGGKFDLRIYNRSGEVLSSVPTISDEKFGSFDRVAVHGGFLYYVDELEIRSL
jgi:hypothetical protein